MASPAPAYATDAERARAGTYARLVRRNRIVAILRIGLPLLGIVFVAVLGFRALIGNTLTHFEFARLLVDRDNLTVEAPVFSGIGGDGSMYEVRAAAARTSLGNPERLTLTDPTLGLTQPNGAVFTATTDTADLDLATQNVTVAGAMAIQTSDGLVGTVWDTSVDVANERILASGGADLVFGNDATIRAETMRYDGEDRLWLFDRATVTLSELPGTQGPAEGGD